MTYDFDTPLDRIGTNSVKWDMVKGSDVLPMWVADMDFASAPEIVADLKERLDHPVFGYTTPGEETLDAICHWQKKRMGWSIEKDWLVFIPGVVPILSMAIRALSQPGDEVILFSPVYPPFYGAIRDNDRVIIDHPLKTDDQGNYGFDLEELAQQVSPKTKLLLLCSPHNPLGRIWSKEELTALGNFCLNHNIKIISDEIHADLIFPGEHHQPLASLNEALANITVSAFAPSKTFNLAGLYLSYAIIPQDAMREAFKNELNKLHLGCNLMGYAALKSAYTKGEAWLDELMEYLEGNKNYVVETLGQAIPEVKIAPSQATFLLWLDFSALGLTGDALDQFIKKEARLMLNRGETFGKDHSHCMRLNIGAPRPTIEEACQRLIQAVKTKV